MPKDTGSVRQGINFKVLAIVTPTNLSSPLNERLTQNYRDCSLECQRDQAPITGDFLENSPHPTPLSQNLGEGGEGHLAVSTTFIIVAAEGAG